MSSSQIRIRNLYKVFGPKPQSVMGRLKAGQNKETILTETGHTVGLQSIELDIQQGEIFVIMGLSGSGKSTLIRHLNRLIDPTEGQIMVDGIDIMTLSPRALRNFRRHKMAMVFQRFGLLPHRNVLDNTAFGLKVNGLSRVKRDYLARQWLADVGLAGYEAQFPNQLSGGQQQRVGLARALCTDPDILLMDEAFSALDPLIRSEMQDQLLELQARLQKTIVFITHDLDEALRLGNRIAILNEGRLIQVGEPKDILLTPADAYVEAFVRDVNRARALTVAAVMKPPRFRLNAQSIDQALQQMRQLNSDWAHHVAADGTYQGVLTLAALERAQQPTSLKEVTQPQHGITTDTILEEVIPTSMVNAYTLPIVDKAGHLAGEISRETMSQFLLQTPFNNHAHRQEKI